MRMVNISQEQLMVAAHVGRSLTGVLLPYCLLLSQAVFLLYLGGQLVMQIQQADRLNC